MNRINFSEKRSLKTFFTICSYSVSCGGIWMVILKTGSTGASVELLQLALNRAGFGPLDTDGVFGAGTRLALTQFQKKQGLNADGIAGPATNLALLPWYQGYTMYSVKPGDSFYSIAESNSVRLSALLSANPGIAPERLRPGTKITLPLPFDVVPGNISCSSRLVAYCVRGLSARYPFIVTGEAGRSVMGRPLWTLTMGQGRNRVLYNASHHANEWICSLVLLRFAEELAKAFISGESIYGESAAEILSYATLCLIPAVNPDGIDLVTGDISAGEYYANARRIAADYPRFRFPQDWKANIRGIDLNLQYPAGWDQARENKYAQGIVSPAPADFVGPAPLSAPEARAMYDFTLRYDPALILAYHTQGEVIYWKYLDFMPEGSENIAQLFSRLSGYEAEDTPFASGFAGYKDWFIQDFDRPGYTIEAGRGENPLPIGQFDKIYRDNLGILTYGALVT